jgi:hypothetical protein
MATDGSGGVLIAWNENRDQWVGSSSDIYAQRLNSAGQPLWELNGAAIAVGPLVQSDPIVLATGDGGGFIAWNEADTVKVTRIGSDGAAEWERPRAVFDNGHDGYLVSLLNDGRGGAFIALGSCVLQRITGTGDMPWGPAGRRWMPGGAHVKDVVEDGAGGTYWLLYRDRSYHIARVDGDGLARWSGLRTLSTGSVSTDAALTPDGACGVIASWIDNRDGDHALYSARLDSVGGDVWQRDGLPINVERGEKRLLGSVTDGTEGVIVVWSNSGDHFVHAQRVDATGLMLPTVPAGPGPLTLGPCVPNPSDAGIVVRFGLSRSGYARVSVFDATGRLVQEVFEGELEVGPHEVYWQGLLNHDRAPAGIYVIVVEALGQRVATRAVLFGGPVQRSVN